MSTDWSKYEATCTECGNKGFVYEGMDDWNRCYRTWEGFDNIEPDNYAVARKKADSRQNNPKCSCGSTCIEQGKYISDEKP